MQCKPPIKANRVKLLKSEEGTSSPHTLTPHCLVETSVNADIRSSHFLHCELADLLDGAGSTLLEAPANEKRDNFNMNTTEKSLISISQHANTG